MRRRLAVALLLWAAAAGAATAPPVGCRPRRPVLGAEISSLAADRLRLAPGTSRGRRPGEHLLRDGRLLIQGGPGQAGLIVDAKSYLEAGRERDLELRRRGIVPGSGHHPLRGLIDDGARFLDAAPGLRTSLGERLRREGLGEGGRAVDELVKRWREAGCAVEPLLVRQLTAWVGMELAVKLGGRLTTAPGERGLVEPVVQIKGPAAPRTVAPWTVVLEALEGGDSLAQRLAAVARPPLPTAPKSGPTDGGARDGGATDGATDKDQSHRAR